MKAGESFLFVDAEIFRNPIHRRKLGNAVWLYLWIQGMADPETGIVAGYRDEDASAELGCAKTTIRNWRRKLESQGYINPQFNRCGIVYIVRADNGLFKIGMTVSAMSTRLQSLRSLSSLPLSLVLTISSSNALCLEQELHKRFNAKRHHGEWFELTDEDIQVLKEEFIA